MFVEDQAFSPSYDLAPTPLSRQYARPARTHEDRKRDNVLTVTGEVGGGGANHTTAWSSINHSIIKSTGVVF
jgi:hypothetical protein